MAGAQMLPELKKIPQLFWRRRWLVYCLRNGHWEAYGDRPGTFEEVLAILFNGGIRIVYKPSAKWRVILLPRHFKWIKETHGRVPKDFFRQHAAFAVFRRSQLGEIHGMYLEGRRERRAKAKAR